VRAAGGGARSTAHTNDSAELCTRRGWAGKREGIEVCGRPNGEGPKLRGQGPRPEAGAARGLPACESRDAGRVTP